MKKKTNWIYKVTDHSTGEVLGIGTAEELVEQGLYGCAYSVSSACNRCKSRPQARRRVERIGEADTPPRPRSVPREVQPLTEDIRRLDQLNAERRQLGKPSLSYGWWKAGLR